MGLISKEEISKTRRYSSSLWRCIKTIFVLFTMFLSFILFSAPIFLSVADAVLPSIILSSFFSLLRLSPSTVSSHISNYDFRYSLIDIPLISIIRSAIILCVYGLCDGPKLSRGPYLTITMICSICSLIYVSFKAAVVFGEPVVGDGEESLEQWKWLCLCVRGS
uniref:MENTAL domain-containing protein n=1 Tax=Brassica oleracea var. oleracea TaxID=109376 RepID=A0A0D3CU14_BRAOL